MYTHYDCSHMTENGRVEQRANYHHDNGEDFFVISVGGHITETNGCHTGHRKIAEEEAKKRKQRVSALLGGLTFGNQLPRSLTGPLCTWWIWLDCRSDLYGSCSRSEC